METSREGRDAYPGRRYQSPGSAHARSGNGTDRPTKPVPGADSTNLACCRNTARRFTRSFGRLASSGEPRVTGQKPACVVHMDRCFFQRGQIGYAVLQETNSRCRQSAAHSLPTPERQSAHPQICVLPDHCLHGRLLSHVPANSESSLSRELVPH